MLNRKTTRNAETYLDEVLVEAVISAIPPASGVDKTPSGDVDVSTHETRPRLCECWARIQEIAFGLLCQRAICIVASQIGQASPLQYQGADGGKSVGLRTIIAAISKQEVIGGDTRRCFESVAQIVGEVDGLLQESVDFAFLLNVSL